MTFEMNASLFTMIAIVLITIAILFLFLKFTKLKSTQVKLELLYSELKQSIDAVEEIIANLTDDNRKTNQQLADELKEVNEVTRHLEHRIANLQNSIESQNQKIEGIQMQEPQDKLYSRAQKMVALGADVEEVMAECELPRAEAEILVSMHQRSK